MSPRATMISMALMLAGASCGAVAADRPPRAERKQPSSELFSRAKYRYRFNDISGALAMLDRCVASDDTKFRADCFALRAEINTKLENFDKALEDTNASLKNGNWQIISSRALLLSMMGRFDEAESDIKAVSKDWALTVNERKLRVFTICRTIAASYGRTFRNTCPPNEHLAMSETRYKEEVIAGNKEPYAGQPVPEMPKPLVQQRDAYAKMLATNPQPETYILKAGIEAHLNHYKQAIEDYSACIKITADSPASRRDPRTTAQCRRGRGLAQFARGNSDDAEQDLQEAAKLLPETYYDLALCQITSGEYTKGAEAIKALLEKAPNPWYKSLAGHLCARIPQEERGEPCTTLTDRTPQKTP